MRNAIFSTSVHLQKSSELVIFKGLQQYRFDFSGSIDSVTLLRLKCEISSITKGPMSFLEILYPQDRAFLFFIQ